jgi:Putative adhesin
MKLNFLIITILLAAATPLYAAPSFSSARVAREDRQGDHSERVERTVAAESNVLVTVCIASGDVIVHGWDRAEVRASTMDAEQLEIRRETPLGSGPASSVEVLVSNGPDTDHPLANDCNASSDITLDVPRGATIQVKTRDGAVEVMDVADARVESLSGDIAVRRISKRVEASSVSGDVSLESSSGPVRLKSISGSVEASNARTIEATDDFEANTVSGEVSLAQVAHSHVEAWTISGIVSMKGPLARGGRYEFKTTSGDILFSLPPDASFRVSARIRRGEILTDFPLKDAAGANHSAPRTQFLTGTHGTGDATLNLYTYSGTVHLRRQPK